MKEMKITPPEGYMIDEERSTIYNIVFKKKDKLPATWEEFCEQYCCSEKPEFYITHYSEILVTSCKIKNRREKEDKNLLSTKKDAEAHLALMQLHRLRDVYRQGWVPNYKEVLPVKYAIKFVNNALFIIQTNTVNNFLTFQSKEIAEEFLENFKDLILEAKELI
jgi:hypothetical protein